MISQRDIELAAAYAYSRARDSFWVFLQIAYPAAYGTPLLIGWWPREVAHELQQFYEAYQRSENPQLIIQAPPQHGKSTLVTFFIAWALGRDVNTRTIYASYSQDLGIRANLLLQRLMSTDTYLRIFPEGNIPTRNAVTMSGQKLRNRFFIEMENGRGYFRNTTIGGAITGMSLDIGVIDDMIKGRAEANSLITRNGAWDWLHDDFNTRFSKHGAMLGIMTRWHIDDPFGRLIEQKRHGLRVLRYPAIAEENERNRTEGEALFPELKPLDFLLRTRQTMPAPSFSALYQQNPVVAGGELFKLSTFKWYTPKSLPRLKWRAIYADTAQKTKEQNDFSVFQCWGCSVENEAVLLDQIRGKWETPDALDRARAFYQKHLAIRNMGTFRGMQIEDASSGAGMIQILRRDGLTVNPIKKRQVDKVSRYNDVTPHFTAGRVLFPSEAHWLSDYITELTQVPAAAHDDQADATADAITDILAAPAQPAIYGGFGYARPNYRGA